VIDGIDTAGTTSGLAFNPHELVPVQFVEQLVDSPGMDGIIRIPLKVGQMSEENNFSEVLVARESTPPPHTPPTVVPPGSNPFLPPVYMPPSVALPGHVGSGLMSNRPILSAGGVAIAAGDLGQTWHLSIIDAGMPRDTNSATRIDPALWMVATHLQATSWESERIQEGRWLIPASKDYPDDGQVHEFLFGVYYAIPVVGDFNGDGVSEIGVYYRGEWFLDLNGNGRWDEEDLWAHLGTAEDLPVVGDWDGDGKDDIGIFGPEWPQDPRAIRNEPGLPDSHNRVQVQPKNIPPRPTEATSGHRLLRLTAQGSGRADVIDHVFRFGQAKDAPVAGDWNGDGIRTIGVFRDGQWRFDSDGDGRWTNADARAEFGNPGDVPLVGDFNGDGVEEIGVYREGMWYLDTNGNRELDAHDRVFALGGPGDQPVVGDWDGDGTDQPGLYQDADGPANPPPAASSE
jgi:hypothetical protein